eukprot:3634698-Rhodomonas_salina.2
MGMRGGRRRNRKRGVGVSEAAKQEERRKGGKGAGGCHGEEPEPSWEDGEEARSRRGAGRKKYGER